MTGNKSCVLVVVNGGLLETVRVFEFTADALRAGREIWTDRSGCKTMAEEWGNSPAEMEEDEPGYDQEWGGVSRGYVMHWWNDDLDIWVAEAE